MTRDGFSKPHEFDDCDIHFTTLRVNSRWMSSTLLLEKKPPMTPLLWACLLIHCKTAGCCYCWNNPTFAKTQENEGGEASSKVVGQTMALASSFRPLWKLDEWTLRRRHSRVCGFPKSEPWTVQRLLPEKLTHWSTINNPDEVFHPTSSAVSSKTEKHWNQYVIMGTISSHYEFYTLPYCRVKQYEIIVFTNNFNWVQ